MRTQRAALADMLEARSSDAVRVHDATDAGDSLPRPWASDNTRPLLATFQEACPWSLVQGLDADCGPECTP